MVWIPPEPAYPEKFLSLGFDVIGYLHVGVKYAEYFGIPVGMRFRISVVFMGQNHDKGMSAGVDRILSATHIIRCVIDSKDVMAIHAISKQHHFLSICVGKRVLIAIVWYILVAGQQVVLQSWYKLLILISYDLGS
jgi:hypothetical protein